jgi:hypothetical protein
MAHADVDPQVLGRKIFLMTAISAIVFAGAAWVLVSYWGVR